MEAKETNITPQAELPILEVEHLRVQFTSDSGTTTAVVDESVSIRPGETLALVGESGSGKSVTSLSVMRLVEHGGGKIVNGSIKLRCRDGRVVDLRHANKSELRTEAVGTVTCPLRPVMALPRSTCKMIASGKDRLQEMVTFPLQKILFGI